MKSIQFYSILSFVLLLSFTSIAQTDKQKELEERRQSILQEITNIKSFLFKTRGEKKTVLTEVEDLSQQIRARENLIRVTNQQANLLTREINNNQSKIEQLRDELVELKEDYGAMIRKSYKSKSQQSRVMFLLSSEDFLQAYKRLQYMKQYAKHRKKEGEKIKEKSALLLILNQDLIDQKKQKDKLIDENRIAKRALDKEKKEQEALIATLKKDEGNYASQINKKQKEAAAIEREIDAIIKAAIAKANKAAGVETKTEATKTKLAFALTPEAKALASDFTKNKGKLPWPVEKGVVVGRYGNQPDPLLPNITRSHSGVEIATAANEEAQAVFGGEVMRVQDLKGTKAVYILHGNYITIYSNLISLNVKAGDKVVTKQKLGRIFENPLTGKTILKFYIYQNTSKMNPADWLYRM
ncbi:murein hydrolase activator EnvC family protein [Jejudonia soesokkakensis]|uniref:Murein hydrolase activator EnvC family protein n=1 Tax=Jejudonia soesokkakensis TaxID=1323432 RepID=A0ABW2MS61_9FLAO